MGEAVWLYMWLLDKITSVNENGEGKVLGGKPITHLDFKVEVGVHKNTYSRYLIRLRDNGYINTVRTPRGMVIVVNKAKKGITRTSDSPKRVIPSIRASESPHQVIAEESQEMGIQYKTKQSRLNKTKQTTTDVVEPAANKSNETINNLFLYWEAQTSIAIQSQVKANRYACSNLLKRYTEPQVQQLIQGVVLAQADKFAPRIADFRDLQAKLNQLLTWGKSQTKKGTIKI